MLQTGTVNSCNDEQLGTIASERSNTLKRIEFKTFISAQSLYVHLVGDTELVKEDNQRILSFFFVDKKR
jgi:hypothetical protein